MKKKKKIRRGRDQQAKIVGGVLSCSVFLSVLLCILPIKGLETPCWRQVACY